MKAYAYLCYILALLVFDFAYALPFLLSERDTFLVLVGVLLFLLSIPLAFFLGMKFIKHITPNINLFDEAK